MRCCVPNCFLKSKKHEFIDLPTGKELRERWLNAVGVGTGYALTAENLPSSTICIWHFMNSSQKLGSDRSVIFLEPLRFMRDSRVVEIQTCQLCYQFECKEEMFPAALCALSENVTEKLFNWSPATALGEYLCSECTIKLDITQNFLKRVLKSRREHEFDMQKICKSFKNKRKSGKVKVLRTEVEPLASLGKRKVSRLEETNKTKDEIPGSAPNCVKISAEEVNTSKDAIENHVGTESMEDTKDLVLEDIQIESTSLNWLKTENVSDCEDVRRLIDETPSNKTNTHVLKKSKTSRKAEADSAENLDNDTICYLCQKDFLEPKKLTKHFVFDHAYHESYVCIVCNKSFDALKSYNSHMWKHKTDPNFENLTNVSVKAEPLS
ncbi:uncharacterized protein LOC129746850 [Uranotaenia lowii]|uniref:uncharacterized protein LOC129746850 n=1 Tax=Uranotaenia lowii TaxID=190385 RepID=UPI00247AE5FC|nr:uncharacterized protein LOC129746850 [Uranotaenia lowii]XP_055596728.1 uncharacterized protein LOC129746850 [Uranotaenia lowii]XP_055596729.1 uncharacterized protein LOC129746850 [Uranotaenia lowii]